MSFVLLYFGFILTIALLIWMLWLVIRYSKYKYKVLICLLVFSLSANAMFLLDHLAETTLPLISWRQTVTSPNDLYIARASSKPRIARLFGPQPTCCIFTIELCSSQQILKTIHIAPVDPQVAGNLCDLPQIIHWSADSTEVEFRIPGTRIIASVKDPEPVFNESEQNESDIDKSDKD